MPSDQRPGSGQRVDLAAVTPAAYGALARLDREVERLGLPPRLRELIKLRASQINGCEFCKALHERTALSHGERRERLDALPAWRESSLFDERERAAFLLAEHLTDLRGGDLDQAYAHTASELGESEAAAVIWTVAAINAWNRIAIGAGKKPRGANASCAG